MSLVESLREAKERISGRAKELEMEWDNPVAFLNYFRSFDFKKKLEVYYHNIEQNFKYHDSWDAPKAIREIREEIGETPFFYAHHEAYESKRDKKYYFDLSFGDLPNQRINSPGNEQETPESRMHLIYSEKILGSE